MSYIGEARGFAKTAKELSDKLRNEGSTLSEEEKQKILNDIKWYEDESRFCWSAARQEAKEDEHADDHDDEPEDEPEDEEDDGD
jgi:hypothetical protein